MTRDMILTASAAACVCLAVFILNRPYMDYEGYGGEVTRDASWWGGGYVTGRWEKKISLARCTTYPGLHGVEMGVCTVPVQRTLAELLR